MDQAASLINRHLKAKEAFEKHNAAMYQAKAVLSTLKAEREKLIKKAIELLGLPENATFDQVEDALLVKELEEIKALEEFETSVKETGEKITKLNEKLNSLASV